jgi:hypothetical protein
MESNKPLTNRSKESRKERKEFCIVTRRGTSHQGTTHLQSEHGRRHNMVPFLVEGPVWDPREP